MAKFPCNESNHAIIFPFQTTMQSGGAANEGPAPDILSGENPTSKAKIKKPASQNLSRVEKE
jgi:hypothetical protein